MKAEPRTAACGRIDTAYKLVADARESGDAPAGETGTVTRTRIGRYG